MIMTLRCYLDSVQCTDYDHVITLVNSIQFTELMLTIKKPREVDRV